MPPAFNLSQDQTLQFNLFGNLLHSDQAASSQGIYSVPCERLCNTSSELPHPWLKGMRLAPWQHQNTTHALLPQDAGLGHCLAQAPTLIGCKLLKSIATATTRTANSRKTKIMNHNLVAVKRSIKPSDASRLG